MIINQCPKCSYMVTTEQKFRMIDSTRVEHVDCTDTLVDTVDPTMNWFEKDGRRWQLSRDGKH